VNETRPIIHWFRQDLRLSDNRALSAAASAGAPVVPLYIFDDETSGHWRIGGASRWWLHNSLDALDRALRELRSRLVLRRGPALRVLQEIVKETNACAIHFPRGYEPFALNVEAELNRTFVSTDVAVKRFSGTLLFEPEQIATKAGEPFRVFTPFWRACLNATPPAKPIGKPKGLRTPAAWPRSDMLGDWKLLPMRPDWAVGLRESWRIGDLAAQKRLFEFADQAVQAYGEKRDRPDEDGTSRLSPYLHWGEISPNQVWHAILTREPDGTGGAASFLREVGWREFCAHLLFHFPDLPNKPFRTEFVRFAWRQDNDALKAWQRGRTGYPIVDAGMRQLWHTGWMHNRVRMIVASFLIKDLLIPWQEGETWFWDTLVDADLANNAAGWQWVAGSGADAAPYFRIFNPVKQGMTFDPMGDYVRQWVPELKELSAANIQAPWMASPSELAAAGVRLGETYPLPIVDHTKARARALAAFEVIKKSK